MKTNSSTPEINEAQLLEVLASLNQISDAINHIGPGDANNSGVSLQLIVESAIRVVPGSSAVIYTYDQAKAEFEAESRVSAQAEGHALSTNPVYSDDAPRTGGIGVRTIQRRRRTLSYEEPPMIFSFSTTLVGDCTLRYLMKRCSLALAESVCRLANAAPPNAARACCKISSARTLRACSSSLDTELVLV